MSKLLPESLEGEALLLQAKTACHCVGAPLFFFLGLKRKLNAALP